MCFVFVFSSCHRSPKEHLTSTDSTLQFSGCDLSWHSLPVGLTLRWTLCWHNEDPSVYLI